MMRKAEKIIVLTHPGYGSEVGEGSETRQGRLATKRYKRHLGQHSEADEALFESALKHQWREKIEEASKDPKSHLVLVVHDYKAAKDSKNVGAEMLEYAREKFKGREGNLTVKKDPTNTGFLNSKDLESLRARGVSPNARIEGAGEIIHQCVANSCLNVAEAFNLPRKRIRLDLPASGTAAQFLVPSLLDINRRVPVPLEKGVQKARQLLANIGRELPDEDLKKHRMLEAAVKNPLEGRGKRPQRPSSLWLKKLLRIRLK